MEILGYQIGILAVIVIATLLLGEKGMWLAVVGTSIWTLVMIFTSWLMILQFVTIFVGLAIAFGIFSSPNFKDIQSGTWGLLVLLIIGGIWLANKNQLFNTAPPAVAEKSEQTQSYAPYQQSSATARTVLPKAIEVTDPNMAMVIARLEAEFPQLNPNSPSYDQRLVNSVLRAQSYYITQGQPPENALERGARETVLAPSSLQARPPLVQSKRQSIYLECENQDGTKEPNKTGCKKGQKTIIRN